MGQARRLIALRGLSRNSICLSTANFVQPQICVPSCAAPALKPTNPSLIHPLGALRRAGEARVNAPCQLRLVNGV